MVSGPGLGLLSAMVEIFAGQGIATVFEGIEETWQLDMAEQSGASMVQGFVLARPELAPTSFANFPTLNASPPVANIRKMASDIKPVPVGAVRSANRAFGRRVNQ
jgi:EAL domain-containing protein (putative c-di-GMP-specific phosphodiesterase class I)